MSTVTSASALAAALAFPTSPSVSAFVVEWLAPDEVMLILRVSKQTLAKWRCEGGGPPYAKFGRTVLYPRFEFEAWLRARVVTSTSEAAA